MVTLKLTKKQRRKKSVRRLIDQLLRQGVTVTFAKTVPVQHRYSVK